MILNFLHTIKAPIVQQLILWNYQCKIISFNYLFQQVIEISLKTNKGTIQNPRLAPGSITVIEIVTLGTLSKMMKLLKV